MAQQVPHHLPAQDEDDLTQLSSPGLEGSPHTLSFINNVQSAVAQIEHRLATSPSAHSPPPSRHELSQSPPGPNDPAIHRAQFLESSLSIPPPKPSKHASLADSAFAGAINPDTSLVSSGAIISTTPPNTLTSNPCTQQEVHHTPQPESQASSPSVQDTTERGVSNPVPSIAPIVEQFETPIAPSVTKEQDAAIVAAPIAPIVEQFEDPSAHADHTSKATALDVASAPIAPIVEHFETSSQPVEKTDNTHTIEPSDERATVPVTEQFDVSAVHDNPILSPSRESGDATLDLKATISEKSQTSSDNCSESVEDGIQAENTPAGVSTVCHLEHGKTPDEASTEIDSRAHGEEQRTSPAADEFTPVPIVDEVGQIPDESENTAGSDGVPPETNTNVTAGDYPQIGPSDIEEASPDTMHQGTEGDIGQSRPDTADFTVPSMRSDEECGSGPCSGGDQSIPCEFDNSVVTEQATASTPVTISSQTDREAGAPSTTVATSNTTPDKIETSEILPVHPSMDPENLKGALASNESELTSNGETMSTTVGDTSLAEKEQQSENYVGQPLNIARTNEGDKDTAPAIDAVDMDESTVRETKAATENAVESVTEQEVAVEYEEHRDSEETSGLPPHTDETSRDGVDSISRELANLNVSQSEETNAKACAIFEKSEDVVVPEARKCEDDPQLEKVTTGVQRSKHLSQESTASSDTEDGSAVISRDKPISPIRTEPFIPTSPKGDKGLNEREVMAAKAVLARDKLAKFSLGSPVKKPHRGPFTRKTVDARESFTKAARTATVSPVVRRSPTGSSPKKSSFNPPKLAAESHKEERKALTSEEQSPLQLSQPSSVVFDNNSNIPRLPRVAGLAPSRSASTRTPHSIPKSRATTRIPRASTFSATGPRSKTGVSSPVLGRKGIASSPVTPTADEKASRTPRQPLRRALSFSQSKPSNPSFSPVSRPLSSRSRESDVSSTLSLSGSGSKPPRGARPRFTVPEPFALSGPQLQERTEKQKEEARRKVAEAEARPRVFKPRPMPDFSKPYPRPQK